MNAPTLSPDLPPLEPCPFCGKRDTLKISTASESLWDEEQEGYPYPHSESYTVACDASKPHGPGGCGASAGYFPTERETIAAWNRRASRAGAAVPPGYVLVPAEPTLVMLRAMQHQIDFDRAAQNTCELEHESQTACHDNKGEFIGHVGTTLKQDLTDAYKAMLAATGSPATQEPDNPLLIDGVQHDPHCLKVYRGPHKECDCGASASQTRSQ